ncbi:hypothetical protein BOX17_00145 [Halomonas aestuarii]|uniref:Nickel/cobalt transporter regulator n=1 Tax=Halomonas aestuarii TaxID=1897729 RepID=A0A1J0VBV6_9GAMM|nr:anti-virulence regulator CigR family protein [Halomonas aestuarii]APE29507.1 hypothetical protein BOX17_00145 [Halomonas aestuarii]
MKRIRTLPALLIGAALGLMVGSAPLLAQPGNGQGEGQEPWKASGKGQGKEQRGGGQGQAGQRSSQGQRGQEQEDADRYREESRERERREVREREREDYRDRERDRDREDYRDRERDREDYRDRERHRDEAGRLRIDEREIREIFRSRREYLRHDDRDSLPPGIRMNLERGKPLPPGIARNFDERVRRDLPTYDGYEWRRVGTDAVLVDLTDEIIHEVIHDILR